MPTPLISRPTATHVAPSVTPAQSGDQILVYWADKSSTNTSHAYPASLTKLAPTTARNRRWLHHCDDRGHGGQPCRHPDRDFRGDGTGLASRAVMYTIALRP